jgi:hypothetical protein
MLIPLLVVYLVALRRRPDDPPMPIPSSVGVALMIVAEGLRHLADIDSDLFIRSLAAATASAAVIVLLIGPSASARSVGPILLLLLAVPLPTGFIEIVTAPLQGLATSAGTVLLVLIGQPAIEGEYTIYIGFDDGPRVCGMLQYVSNAHQGIHHCLVRADGAGGQRLSRRGDGVGDRVRVQAVGGQVS